MHIYHAHRAISKISIISLFARAHFVPICCPITLLLFSVSFIVLCILDNWHIAVNIEHTFPSTVVSIKIVFSLEKFIYRLLTPLRCFFFFFFLKFLSYKTVNLCSSFLSIVLNCRPIWCAQTKIKNKWTLLFIR